MQSQESAPLEESSQPINTQTDEKMSDASGEFDRKPEKDVNKTKKPKGKRKTAKHEDSQDSVIRVGDNNNNTEMMLGEQEEEDAILERELQGLDDQGEG
jgi:hypothetical protein